MIGEPGFIILESGKYFSGLWLGGQARAGEVVFNTAHSGYEEIATDPSYHMQILVMTAPMQGNYGADDNVWESSNLHIQGFICLEMQSSARDQKWFKRLESNGVPILAEVDTRELVLHLRDNGTTWGAIVPGTDLAQAQSMAKALMEKAQKQPKDWAFATTCQQAYDLKGALSSGPKVAVIDYGCKKNILNELIKRCSQVRVFPSRTKAQEIKAWEPHGILLSNGPGDPKDIEESVETIKDLLGWRFIFGICMGHHLLCMALGGSTRRLKFGHRGSNHPIKDDLLQRVYVTSQNHGYVVDAESLPSSVKLTHTNLNDQTLAGVFCETKKCMSVQFHPESHPGPHDAENLFDEFLRRTQ